jgi:hypothetical protein
LGPIGHHTDQFEMAGGTVHQGHNGLLTAAQQARHPLRVSLRRLRE